MDIMQDITNLIDSNPWDPKPEEAPVTVTVNNWTTVDTSVEDTPPTLTPEQEAHAAGYDKGKADGKREVQASIAGIRTERYNTGHATGKAEGERQARNDIRERLIAWYKTGDYGMEVEDLNALLSRCGMEPWQPVERVRLVLHVDVDVSEFDLDDTDNIDLTDIRGVVTTGKGSVDFSHWDVEVHEVEDYS